MSRLCLTSPTPAIIGLLLLASSAASADDTINLRVETVLATDTAQEFDIRLTGMRSQLLAFRYSAYRLVQEERRKVGFGKQANFSLPGGRFLQVVPKEYANEKIALHVMLMEGTSPSPLMSTLLSIPNRGMLFVGGRKHQGGTLIIRIGASTDTFPATPSAIIQTEE